jgi:methionine--tRNA ligase beta chain
MATIADLSLIDLRVGKIIGVEDVVGAKKPIYRLKIDLGEMGTRDVAAGIKDKYTKESLINRSVVMVSNLEPKKVVDFESQGMLLAAGEDEVLALLQPDIDVKPGTKVR